MKFNEFIKKYKLKDKATSNVDINRVLSSLSLNEVGIYLRHGPFESDIGIVNLHPSKGTHWVCYIYENYFDSYGCVCPKRIGFLQFLSYHQSRWLIKNSSMYISKEKKNISLLGRKPPLFFTFFIFSSDVHNKFHIGLSQQHYPETAIFQDTRRISHTMMINYPRNPYDENNSRS